MVDVSNCHTPKQSPLAQCEQQYQAYRSTKIFGSLDGLRCASIVAVIWHHTAGGSAWFPASNRGFLGVDMFFVLSGFLIVTLLLREKERFGNISLKKFYMRRTLRIFPIYYGLLFALGVTFLFIKPHANSAHSFFAFLPFYLTYTSNWITQHAANLGITWSLATEEQFYLIWPAIEKFVKGWWLVLVLSIVIIMNQLMNFRVIDPWFQEWFGVGYADLSILQITFTPIALGVGLAHLLHHPRGFAAISTCFGRRSSSLICLILLIATCNIPANDISGLPRLLMQTCMAILLASCVVQETHLLTGVLKWLPVRRIGVISYGMYLYHMWARHAAVEVLDRLSIDLAGSLFVLCLALTVIAAELSYRCYELPFLRLKHRFTRA